MGVRGTNEARAKYRLLEVRDREGCAREVPPRACLGGVVPLAAHSLPDDGFNLPPPGICELLTVLVLTL